MAINIPESTPSDFPELPVGSYQASIAGVWDIGVHKSEWQGDVKYNHQVIVCYEFSETIPTGDYAGDKYTVNRWVNLPKSFDDRSKFIQLRNAAESRATTAADYINYDEQGLIGKNVLVNVEHTPKGKPKIVSDSPLIKGMPPLIPTKSPEMPKWVKENFLDKAIQEGGTQAPQQSAAPQDDLPF